MQTGDFNRELQESLASIKAAVSTSINFEGLPPMLLVDEVQFLLNAGCVTLECPPDSAFGNILADENAALVSWSEKHPWKEEGLGKPSSALTVRRKEFPPIGSESEGDVPLRLAVRRVAAAYECMLRVRTGDSRAWKLTVYYEPTAVSSRFWDEHEFLKYVEEALQFVSKKFDPASRLFISERETLYRRFFNSTYLTSVLDTLQQRIDEHLRQSDVTFASPASPGFFFQFYLVTDWDAAGGRHRLRYFPLPDELPALQDSRMIRHIKDALRATELPVPEDITKFITEDYLCTGENDFVGYCCDTAASLYLENWQSEPRAQGAHLDQDQKQQRRVATVIFQTLRSNTPHQFLVPLFANRRPIGVVALNCPGAIEPESRLLFIRSARDLGYLLTMALKTDDLVDHLQEKKLQAAEARAYKYITSSMLHTEGAYCMELERLLHRLAKLHLPQHEADLSSSLRRLAFVIREKKSLIDEFRSIDDPIRKVLPRSLYPASHGFSPEEAAITVEEVTSLVDVLVTIFCQGQLDITLCIGPTLQRLQKIPNFDYYVIARLLANLIKNSRRVGQLREADLRRRGVTRASLTLTVDIVARNGQDDLSIIAVDNCGGFELKDVTLPWRLSFEEWSRYLERVETTGGMGFFMFARYAAASGGVCVIDNVYQPHVGARVDIRIPLASAAG